MMMKTAIAAVFLAAVATSAYAAQPADGVYSCTRGDAAIGDIEIAGTTYRTRVSGDAFAEGGDYVMLDDVSVYWLTDPAILTLGNYRVDNTKVTDTGFTVTVLADGASDFETVSCVAN
jgi:hypothetical protein